MSKSPTLSNPAGQTGLVRCMGFWQVWAIGVGAVVGDGIFLYLGQAVQAGGPSSLLGTFIAGVIQMLIMVSMGELAVGMPCAGAMSVWVEKYLGKFAGLFSGLTFSVGWVIMGGSTSIALGTTMVYWLPNFLPGPAGIIFWALVWFSVFVVMNIMGAQIAGKGQLIMVVVL
ncbi:MAG: amino acid permease, partial [Clostridiales bacterium]|nr:amino acid permease [Clostridiales bacterium]